MFEKVGKELYKIKLRKFNRKEMVFHNVKTYFI